MNLRLHFAYLCSALTALAGACAMFLAISLALSPSSDAQSLFAPPPVSGQSVSAVNVRVSQAPTNDNGPSQGTLPPPRGQIRPLPTAPEIAPPAQSPPIEAPVQSLPNIPSANQLQYPAPAGDFPALPPDPSPNTEIFLPPLHEELAVHGGSYMYHTEQQKECIGEIPISETELRLSEDWFAPQPLTYFAPFLGTGPIEYHPKLHWPGSAYYWEPRFVGYGSYQLFGFAIEQNGQRQDAIGHQLLVELDLQLTGTERFHVQYRPIGKQSSGGSYYQFSDPEGYVDNSTAIPDRFWFEGELHSMLGDWVDPLRPLDINLVVGRYPMNLQNGLLLNDNITGAAISKNNLYVSDFSNVNLQAFYGYRDPLMGRESNLFGVTAFVDYRRAYLELTYAYSADTSDDDRNAHYLAASATQFYGRWTLAGRSMFKIGDEAGTGDGQLYVLESNYETILDHPKLGVEEVVYYLNSFYAANGWTSLGGGNFNRLTSAFEVNPLVQISTGGFSPNTAGVVGGMHMFRHHQDESIIPEVAFESRDGVAVYGVGLRYQRKTTARSFFEAYGVLNTSDDVRYRREGVFLSHTWIF